MKWRPPPTSLPHGFSRGLTRSQISTKLRYLPLSDFASLSFGVEPVDNTMVSASRIVSLPSSVMIATPLPVISLNCTCGYTLTLSFASLSRKYFLNIQNLASIAGSGKVKVTFAPFFSTRK